MTTTLTVKLPRSHAKQVAIESTPAKRVVVCAGRRGGKTTLAAKVSCKKLKQGRRVLLSSTTQEQADAFWDKCKTWLGEFIAAGVIRKNESRRILTFPSTGGRLKVKTAWDADTLRGDYADFLVLDECAYLAADAWEKVGAPMLLDNDGDAWFISTPNRRNWFFKLFQKARSDGKRWQAFHFTSYDNPHLSEAALAELMSDMPEDDIKQEILAQFLEGSGAVFRNINAVLTAPQNASVLAHAGHDIVAGLDWAQKHDYTCMSVGCATCRQELELVRFNQIGWALQRDRVKSTHAKWNPYQILGESNSIGGPNMEALAEEDIPIVGFETTASSKRPLIRGLALVIERKEFQFLNDAVATGELEAYEQKQTASGFTTFSAPEGMNDDTVMARALMVRAASSWGSLA